MSEDDWMEEDEIDLYRAELEDERIANFIPPPLPVLTSNRDSDIAIIQEYVGLLLESLFHIYYIPEEVIPWHEVVENQEILPWDLPYRQKG